MIRLRELNPNSKSYFRPSDDYMKYSTSLENKVYKTIKDLHNYEIPEISTIQTSKVDKNYENWLKDFVER